MCRDQNLISETDVRTDVQTNERMKIEKPGVDRPLLGPATIEKGPPSKEVYNHDINNPSSPPLFLNAACLFTRLQVPILVPAGFLQKTFFMKALFLGGKLSGASLYSLLGGKGTYWKAKRRTNGLGFTFLH